MSKEGKRGLIWIVSIYAAGFVSGWLIMDVGGVVALVVGSTAFGILLTVGIGILVNAKTLKGKIG